MSTTCKYFSTHPLNLFHMSLGILATIVPLKRETYSSSRDKLVSMETTKMMNASLSKLGHSLEPNTASKCFIQFSHTTQPVLLHKQKYTSNFNTMLLYTEGFVK